MSALPGEIVRGSTAAPAALDYLAYRPSELRRNAPLLVAVHGYTRNAAEQAERFAPLCEAAGVVLAAPHFDEQRYRDYQRLGTRGLRADVALECLISELRARLGLLLGRVALFGFSGGGQFVHRVVMAHPNRFASAAIVAPGWFTFPNREQVWPLGLRGARKRLGVALRPEAFLRIPLLVAVGEHDDDERAENLRREPRIDEQQGVNRLERAERWVRAMQASADEHGCAASIDLALIPNAAHSFADCMDNGLGELVLGHAGFPVRQTGLHAKRLTATA